MTPQISHLTGCVSAEEIERIATAQSRLQLALAVERHNEIARHDDELSFWLRSAAVKLSREALRTGCVALARELLVWAESDVPRAERERIIKILIGL